MESRSGIHARGYSNFEKEPSSSSPPLSLMHSYRLREEHTEVDLDLISTGKGTLQKNVSPEVHLCTFKNFGPQCSIELELCWASLPCRLWVTSCMSRMRLGLRLFTRLVIGLIAGGVIGMWSSWRGCSCPWRLKLFEKTGTRGFGCSVFVMVLLQYIMGFFFIAMVLYAASTSTLVINKIGHSLYLNACRATLRMLVNDG